MKRALLVHGLFRSPLSMMPLAAPLRKLGYVPGYFAYASTFESWERIIRRLTEKIRQDRPRIAIGHSLGGILLRLAIERSGHHVDHLIMLGTPNHSPRIARALSSFRPYHWLTGESGRFLADPSAYERLPALIVPSTVIAGTIGHRWQFGNEPNDGIVSLSEAAIDPDHPPVTVPAVHSFLMLSPEVRKLLTQSITGAMQG